ncbi:MAG TPA: retropepsin-like aspartic protease [Verrucomicrobiae bacterium]
MARLQNTVDVGRSLAGKLPASRIRQVEVELLVDTGAAMLCLTPKIIERLGLHKLHERDVITGNGLVKRAVYEPVRIQILDREADMNVMEVPSGTPLLLGYLPLEALDLYPNPKKRILEGNPQYDGKMITDLL